jgi:hypothetical protein
MEESMRQAKESRNNDKLAVSERGQKRSVIESEGNE